MEEAPGSDEDSVELGGLPDGARGRPWRRGHVTSRLLATETLVFLFLV